MEGIIEIIQPFINGSLRYNFWHYIFFGYTLLVMLTYFSLAVISIRALRIYLKENKSTDYSDILNSPLAPSVSLIAPAFDEENTIVDNIRSLLSLTYRNFEVIVVNDGSKDTTLSKAIESFDLVKVPYTINQLVSTQTVLKVYKSKNPLYQHLIVVDKLNGGKADALNAGINVSGCDYIMCIDADCVLSSDALLKLMKPFLEESDKKVIATGGVLRIANSCKIEHGQLSEAVIPSNWLARSQALEYLRTFLLARVGWSYIEGLILVSGALGVFDKKTVLKVGGYSRQTVGEDMELVVRMRRYMHEQKTPYRVAFIPDPLCWTEVPETFQMLSRQRNRWTRGTMETLKTHRKIFLNPQYGRMGMISYPYWLMIEWFAPLLEFIGCLFALGLALSGHLNWPFFLLMLVLVWSFSGVMTALTLFGEEITFHKYRSLRSVLRLFLTGILEPFWFHPFLTFAAVKGNIAYLTGRNSWGEMKRKGFRAKEIQIIESVKLDRT